MKKLLFFILFLFVFSNIYAQWTLVQNLQVVFSFSKSGNNLIAGTVSGICISSNNGITWVNVAYSGLNVYSTAALDNKVFAGNTSGTGDLYFSSNNGNNWPALPQNSLGINFLAINQSYLFCGARSDNTGFYRSTNDGVNWVSMFPCYVTYTMIAKDQTLFISYRSNTLNKLVSRSTDNGDNWTVANSGLGTSQIVCFGFSDSCIFSGDYNGSVYYSTNNGTNWILTSSNHGSPNCIASLGHSVLVGTNAGVYLTTDNGTTWIQKNEGINFTPSMVTTLFIANNFIYAGLGLGGTAPVYRRPCSDFITEINNTGNPIPTAFYLSENYPNPFNPVTKINFDLPKDGNVKLVIYDILGRELKTLVNEYKHAGSYSVEFDGSQNESGIYFYKIQVNGSKNFIASKKMVLVK